LAKRWPQKSGSLRPQQKGGRAMMPVFLHIALLKAMRSGEITGLRWSQIHFRNQVITVGKTKTASGTGRQIPTNDELLDVLGPFEGSYIERFGDARPDWYVFPFVKPTPQDATRADHHDQDSLEHVARSSKRELPIARPETHCAHQNGGEWRFRTHDAGDCRTHEPRHARKLPVTLGWRRSAKPSKSLRPSKHSGV
jgi:integrase